MLNKEYIKIQIIKSGMNQKQIADKLGISEITLSKWVNGNIGYIEKFIDLCILLDIDIKKIKKDS